MFSFLVKWLRRYHTGLSASMTLAAFWTHCFNQFQPFSSTFIKGCNFYWRQACQICHKHPTLANIGYFFVASWGSPRLPFKKSSILRVFELWETLWTLRNAVYNTFFLGFSVDSANVKQYVLSFSPRPLLYLNTTWAWVNRHQTRLKQLNPLFCWWKFKTQLPSLFSGSGPGTVWPQWCTQFVAWMSSRL